VADGLHIALFTPGYPYVDAALRALELSKRHGGTFSRSIGEPLAPRRDEFARWFVDSDASHALLLEGDVVPPEDIVERLMKVRAPVVTALYPQWVDERLSTNVQATTDATWSDTVPPRVFSVRRCLLGCVLVQRDVFKRVPSPWFLSTMTATRFVGDDEWFCNAVREAGMGIRCDGSALCASVRQGANLLAIAGGTLHKGA
jgi:hypothetical protein